MKPFHQIFGSTSEDLAVVYLQNKGFTILQRNYRYKQGEIDVIATKDELLIFVEIKARRSIKFGYPEEFVDYKKQKRLVQ